MPQMAPMYWMTLFMLFILLFMMFNSMIYFTLKIYKSDLLKKLFINQMIWKW